jgi:UDP-glucose/iron transport system permease protein
MLIGNSMTATSLAGNRLRDELADKTAEIEVRLALGVSASEALLPYRRRAVVTGLIPTIDATKNVGLIFLPGAFVGMVLAGESPADAARVQLIVLFMLLGAVAVAGMSATMLVARAFVAPGERLLPPAR